MQVAVEAVVQEVEVVDVEDKKTITISVPNVWTVLIVITLVLTLVNIFTISSLNSKLDSISGNIVGVNGEEIEIQEVPSQQPSQQPKQQPAQQPTQQQPSRAEVSVENDDVKGSADAPVTIIEFSDFECPFCTRFFEQTLPLIEKNYIETGKVNFVYRDFPLGFHPNAQKAAEAAECAGEQNKYWEMHDKLFEEGDLDITSLKQYAQGIGLDTSAFNNCLDSGSMESEIQKDAQDGQAYGVSGTPTFFINGIKVVGAQPYSAFEQAIENELNNGG